MRHTLDEVLNFYADGWHIRPRRSWLIMFLIADLIEAYMKIGDHRPMINTAKAMAESRYTEPVT